MTTQSSAEPTGSHSTSNPTLAVVARTAGVSVPTVSKVINGREDVAIDTRRRVQEAIRRLGYVHRRRSDTRLPRLLDLIAPYQPGRPAMILQAVEAAVQDAGFDIVVSSAMLRGRTARLRTGSLDRLRARGTTGVLFDSVSLSDSQHSWLARHRIPYVLLDPVSDAPAQVPTVAAAERAGATQAVAHLRSAGHDRIALITGTPGSRRSESHVDGFRSGLRAFGGDAELDYTRHADFDTTRATQEMNLLLDLPEPPTAVLVCSSSMAAGVHRALHLRGLSVPDDMSVVAFNDQPALSWVMPQFLTVKVPAIEMATEAMRMLIRMIGGEVPTVPHVELPTRLVVRPSSVPQRLR